MKHIKYFSALNESLQDVLELKEIIRNSPEGRDLQKVVSRGAMTFDEIFNAVRTGRLYIENYGSKTFIDKLEDGRYRGTSLSNGVPFWTEYYGNAQECLRKMWSNTVSKRISGQGMKKNEIREWIENNINPGEELSLDDIKSRYIESQNLQIFDPNDLVKLQTIKSLNDLFPRMNLRIDSRGVVLRLDLGNSIFGNTCGYNQYRDSSTYGIIDIKIRTVSDKSSNSLKWNNRYEIPEIKLKSSSSIDNDLSKMISRIFKKMADNENFLVHNIKCYIIDFFAAFFSSEESEKYGDVYKYIESEMEEIATVDPVRFYNIVDNFKKSENPKIIEIYNNLSSKYATIIRGAGISSRFGIR